MKYYAGQALPGTETRAAELAPWRLDEVLGLELVPGTFNVGLTEELELGEPDAEHGPYHSWFCHVSTREMIEADKVGYPGWILRVAGEDLPLDFVEIVSPFHIRTAMNRQHWPAFGVEIAI